MPLTTSLEFNSHPDIEIIVSDGGGGSGKDHVVDVLFTYDPLVMACTYADPTPFLLDDSKGICLWSDVFCAANGKTFRIKLERIRAATTKIGFIAMDLENGEKHPANPIKPVPDDFKRPVSPLRKRGKKGRKKP